MARETENILDAFDYDILELADGKNNITQIFNKINFTYKSTFLRIKKLKSLGIVKLTGSNDVTSGTKVSINPNFKKVINKNIKDIKLAKERLEDLKKENIKLVKWTLKYLNSKVYVRNLELEALQSNKFNSETDANGNKNMSLSVDMINLNIALEEAGLVSHRLMLTRKGMQFLKELEE